MLVCVILVSFGYALHFKAFRVVSLKIDFTLSGSIFVAFVFTFVLHNPKCVPLIESLNFLARYPKMRNRNEEWMKYCCVNTEIHLFAELQLNKSIVTHVHKSVIHTKGC